MKRLIKITSYKMNFTNPISKPQKNKYNKIDIVTLLSHFCNIFITTNDLLTICQQFENVLEIGIAQFGDNHRGS